MTKSPRYYQLLHAIKTVRKITRGKPCAALDILNEMRVQEYCRIFRCGLSELGLLWDPAALRVLKRLVNLHE